MRQKHWLFQTLTLMLILGILFFAASCTKTKISSEPVTTTTAEEEARKRAEEDARQKELERQKALREEELKEESLSEKAARERERLTAEQLEFENKDIYFEFDSIRLTPEAQQILTQKANWLQENPGVMVTIEGHCDNRGTNEYNLALGEGRAQSAKTFLIDLGVDPGRLDTISYGEERPLDPHQTEDAWAKNRRVHFVIK